MDYYDSPDNVESYIKMCADYDGTPLYTLLEKHLPAASTLLEIGIGSANDLGHLAKRYVVTGSDQSTEFLRRAQSKYSEILFLQLDATTINTEEQFDAIYSNKVLHHLTIAELKNSCLRQQQVIAPNGLFAHTFWISKKAEEMEMHGLFVFYHARDELIALISDYFEIVELFDYAEFEEDDSLFVIARNNEMG